MVAAVDQHRVALALSTFAPPMMLRRPPGVDRLDAEPQSKPTHAVVADRNMLVGEQVDDVAVIQADLVTPEAQTIP